MMHTMTIHDRSRNDEVIGIISEVLEDETGPACAWWTCSACYHEAWSLWQPYDTPRLAFDGLMKHLATEHPDARHTEASYQQRLA